LAGKSDFLEGKILDHMLGGPDYVRPATVYVALFTVAPTADAGTGGTEVSVGAYARVAVTNDATNFPAATGGVKSNGTVITFPTATAPWGTIVAFGIYDAASAGNLLFWNVVTANKVITTNDIAQFPIGSLVFTED
jgi:hypothetical protein